MRWLSGALLLWLSWSAYGIDYEPGTSFIEPLRYAPDFLHFEYANPDAPKGGTVRFPELGTFDSFNNILDKGRVASGVSFMGVGNLVYDRLLEPAIDCEATCHSNFYFIPTMAQPGFRLVYWDKFGQLTTPPLQRVAWLDTWWWDETKAKRVRAGMAELTGSR